MQGGCQRELKEAIKKYIPRFLQVRIVNVFWENNIKSFNDLKKLSPKHLLEMRNFGQRSYQAVITMLEIKKIFIEEKKCPYCGQKISKP